MLLTFPSSGTAVRYRRLNGVSKADRTSSGMASLSAVTWTAAAVPSTCTSASAIVGAPNAEMPSSSQIGIFLQRCADMESPVWVLQVASSAPIRGSGAKSKNEILRHDYLLTSQRCPMITQALSGVSVVEPAR